MNSDTIIAERIKQKRKELKMTQRGLAKAARATPTVISAYEKAQKKPSIGTMIKIAEALNVSIDWLCGKETVKEIKTLEDVVEVLLKIDNFFSICKAKDENEFVLRFDFKDMPRNYQDAFMNFISGWKEIEDYDRAGDTIFKEVKSLWVNEELKKLKNFVL